MSGLNGGRILGPAGAGVPLNPPTTAVRLSKQVAVWVDAALGLHGFGDEWTWEMTIQLVPGPNGAPVPVLILVLIMASPIVGQRLVGPAQIPMHQVDEPAITNTVAQMIAGLRGLRAQQLGQTPPGVPG